MRRIKDTEYRDAAKKLFGTEHLTVSVWGGVHRVAEGAYVEMTAWLTNEQVQELARQQVPEKS